MARAEGDGPWQFLGVLPLFDPPREDAKSTIAIALAMGVKDRSVRRVHDAPRLALGRLRLGLCTGLVPHQSINDLEAHLHRNGTCIIKIFLHLSKDEQRERLLDRIDEPDKNWKFSRADIKERKLWDKYMEAYGECLSATSAGQAQAAA